MGNIVGIDLGTTFSAIAKLDETGRPEIVDNLEGKNITPSVVEFTSATTFLVGDEAKAQIGANDENIAQEVKRSMGNSSTKYEFFGETHTPTSISALILKKLKEARIQTKKRWEELLFGGTIRLLRSMKKASCVLSRIRASHAFCSGTFHTPHSHVKHPMRFGLK